MTESIRDTALRLAKKLDLQLVLRFDYEGFEISQEELETLVRLAMQEGMERAAKIMEAELFPSETTAQRVRYFVLQIRKMKEEL